MKRAVLQDQIKEIAWSTQLNGQPDVPGRGMMIMGKMDAFLNDGNQLNIETFNVFLKALNDLQYDKGMTARHKHYLFAVEQAQLIPTTITFNMLLKGVRLSSPPLYKFLPYFLNEMARFNVSYDDCTFNEMITLCAQFPSPRNVVAAKSWLDGYKETRKYGEISNRLILNSYFNVLVMAHDWRKAFKFVDWLKRKHIWNEKMQHTFEKMEIKRDSLRPSSPTFVVESHTRTGSDIISERF